MLGKLRIYFVKKAYELKYRNRVLFKKGVNFRSNFKIQMEKSGQIIIGENVFFNNGCSINSLNEIVIGSNCLFGENVHIYDHNHIYI